MKFRIVSWVNSGDLSEFKLDDASFTLVFQGNLVDFIKMHVKVDEFIVSVVVLDALHTQ